MEAAVKVILDRDIKKLCLPGMQKNALSPDKCQKMTLPSTLSGSMSVESDEILILSPHSTETHKPWPTEIPIPNNELVLEKSYPGVKSNILVCLAELIFSCPSDLQRCAVVEALIKNNPCLKEPS